MLHGAPALPQIQHGPQRSGEVLLRPPNGCRQVKAFGQIGRDGAGQGAADPVGVGVIDVRSVEPCPNAARIEIIVGVIKDEVR